MSKWISEIIEDEYNDCWYEEDFSAESEEEVVEKTKTYLKENNIEADFRVGEVLDVRNHIPLIDADNILEYLDEQINNEVEDYEWDYFDDITVEAERELEDKLNAVLLKWLNKHIPEGKLEIIPDAKIIKSEEWMNQDGE